MSGIYRIDLGNGNFYIGSASKLTRRKLEHLRRLQGGNHHNIRMQNSWNKYRVFNFTVVEQCEIELLTIREQVWINRYFGDPKNLNIAPVANSTLGVILSQETRSKMSLAKKGRKASEEARAKMSMARKGIPLSPEHRAKLSAIRKGMIYSPEARAKMSASHKGKKRAPFTQEHRANMSSAVIASWARRRAAMAAVV